MQEYCAVRHALEGVLIGCAVGDSIGLPAEGLSPARISRLGWGQEWRHRFFLGRGMISDDTEHTLFVAQALLKESDDPEAFARILAGKLRWWLASLPAGIGLSTGRAIFKLWVGFSPRKSGVFSAGNGPVMRSAIVGAFFRDQPEKLERFVAASTRLTHTDPKALISSLAVARVAAFFASRDGEFDEKGVMGVLDSIEDKSGEWENILARIKSGLEEEQSLQAFCAASGFPSLGVTGYVYHTVPAVMYALLQHRGEFLPAMEELLSAGGDTDTTAAILGAVLGARGRRCKIPKAWEDGIVEWPRSTALLRRVAEQLNHLQEGRPAAPVGYFWPGVLVRNAFFLMVVLCHGFLRLVPGVVLRKVIR